MRSTGFKRSYLTNCEDHGFQVLVFENCEDHGFLGVKMVNLGGGALSKKSPDFFTYKSSFWVDLNVLYFFCFFKELSFIFPNKMRMFFFNFSLKSKDIFFFRENLHLFLKKSCAL